ncbi:MAG TPA: DNA/RNA non-specific endonuclease [Rhodocyclaceae bacterium]|nr:DNA/RNA non-specific endonuclease [Rhodocyclaceae bacterium]
MSVLLHQIDKAEKRSAHIDLPALLAQSRGRVPVELNDPAALAQRKQFIRDSAESPEKADRVFERVIAGNEIQDVNYLARGEVAARAVARVAIRTAAGGLSGYGSGFLIAPSLLLTNHHVLPAAATALKSEAHFGYELDVDGHQQPVVAFALAPERFYFSSEPLDFTLVAVAPRSLDARAALSDYGYLPLVAALGKAVAGEWLTIVQHPRGERKQLCVRENKLLKRDDDVLWYSTDTLAGSSGSPVFTNDWFVVALHHAGVPLKDEAGNIQTVMGRAFNADTDDEEDIQWLANEGIRVSRIVDTLRRAMPDNPLLAPVFNATPENSRIGGAAPDAPQPAGLPAGSLAQISIPPAKESPMNYPADSNRSIVVTLGIDSAGGVSVLNSSVPAQEGFRALEGTVPKPTKAPPAFDVPFNDSYADRKGYDPAFLGSKSAHHVLLPQLTPGLAHDATLLVGSSKNYVLNYHNYSLVMHKRRKFAIYTAANVDFGGRFDLARPTDVWRYDPRIPRDAQIGEYYYSKNQFDRGHLTRREDLEYGATRTAALVSAADTCHFSNCTPQHARFNQNKSLWQGIERYLLESSIQHEAFRAQIMTGPILAEDDPVWARYDKVQYPVRFWKVVAAVSATGKLFATAYILDQSAVIAEFGIEAAPVVPFGDYMHFQVKIAEVERLTGLKFQSGMANAPKSLSDVDPLAKLTPRPRRVASRVQEAAMVNVPEGYRPLLSLDDVLVADD